MFMVLASNQKLTNYDPRRIPLLTRTAERSVGSAQSMSATGSPNLDLSNPEYQKDPLASRLSSVTKILSSVHKSVVCGQLVWQKWKAEELEEQEAGLELAGCIRALFWVRQLRIAECGTVHTPTIQYLIPVCCTSLDQGPAQPSNLAQSKAPSRFPS